MAELRRTGAVGKQGSGVQATLRQPGDSLRRQGFRTGPSAGGGERHGRAVSSPVTFTMTASALLRRYQAEAKAAKRSAAYERSRISSVACGSSSSIQTRL